MVVNSGLLIDFVEPQPHRFVHNTVKKVLYVEQVEARA